MKILLAVMVLFFFAIGVFAAEPSLSEREAQIETIKARRQAAVADYKRGEALKDQGQLLMDNAILRDAAYEAQQKGLESQLETQKKK